ncbi:PREDICTED: probable desiccation-related protein LEA14 [Brassica oleracea var. oleracea]|uniref:Water stress and hypersensitive response domain-containing protein n=1 Tax=Brassica oleracea var. oleracea TaxID=109376 RepID=A0A0D3AZ67_BRAOL|nr:PREDICTED: probable desiccation-related protein LEA14 [Brassica oleracea var. oleracea]
MASLLDKAKDFVADNLAGVPKPEGSVTDVDLKDVNRDSVEYLAKVSVTNPYGHAIPICEINFTIHSGGREIGKGKIPDPGSLKAKDMTVLDVPIVVPYSILFNLARDVGADWDIDYLLEIGLSIDLPVLGDFTIPVTSKGEIKLPTFKDYF